MCTNEKYYFHSALKHRNDNIKHFHLALHSFLVQQQTDQYNQNIGKIIYSMGYM